ncbi:uncharacterized protein CMU_010860 [Cryptosporidium muris RN66]|uniref:Uncharacterized protein n=1 Tax=Cryptosporidium muris (strain RN66) TaxID=441375 RepID=B6AIU7_CRYMR|nr:uncharacterized protein CMU_010860 [Cryptosporidium muris RN66]EEA08138.1 hypothetical protein, conserved [Cryptosporidium muris RN66]|eukprot:XP_002142487.1 hypothetical protein [Cryptosporidium muris RN66]
MSETSKHSKLDVIRSIIKKKGNEIRHNTKRDHFSCLLCIKFSSLAFINDTNSKDDINDSVYIVDLLEAYLNYSIYCLLNYIKNKYCNCKSSEESIIVYSTFDIYKFGIDIQKINYRNFCNGLDVRNLGSNIESLLGIHVSLCSNQCLNKLLSLKFLEIIIQKLYHKFGEHKIKANSIESGHPSFTPLGNPEHYTQNKLCIPLEPFPLVYNTDHIVDILENQNFQYNSNYKISNGVFACIRVSEVSKALYIDPIIDIVDKACLELGLNTYPKDRIIHSSLVYIKADDLDIMKDNILGNITYRNVSFEEFLSQSEYSSKLPLAKKPLSIWVDKLYFRLGIKEYTLHFKY